MTQTILDKIRKLTPLHRMAHLMLERERVRLLKVAGSKPPWTTDPILQTYRFCNIRRMDDKVSQWFLKNWYNPHFGHPRMVQAACIARLFNNPEALAGTTEAIFEGKKLQLEKIRKVLKGVRDSGGKTFNAAYIVTTAGQKADKIDFMLDKYIAPVKVDVDHDSMENTHKSLLTNYGFASFTGGQVVADLRYALPGNWADRDMWAPLGPGSKRGLNRLLGLPLKRNFSQKEFSQQLPSVIEAISGLLPHAVVYPLEAMDWQNCLCEFDKYERVLHGEGRPKQLYQGIN